MPKVFLSFATEDLDFIIRLFDRLKRLGCDIWDYSHRDEEIGWGEKIKPVLAERILESDYFMPVASLNSIDPEKECIQFEVKLALDNSKACYPIMIATRRPPGRPRDWKGAFALLSDRVYLDMDHTNNAGFEAKIAVICDSLGIPYVPEIADHTRLPLFRKMQREIDTLAEKIEGFKNRFVYEQLMRLVSRFNSAYSVGNWQRSLDVIGDLQSFERIEFDTTSLYFPLIARGACELQLNLLNDAEKTFKKAALHPIADENAYGGLGHVYLRRHHLGEALAQFNLALAVCPPGLEIEILYNILMVAVEILSDEDIHDPALTDQALDMINGPRCIPALQAQVFASAKDSVLTNNLIGVALFKSRNYKKARAYFKNIFDRETFWLTGEALVSEANKEIVSTLLHEECKKKGFLIPVGLSICKSFAQDGGQQVRIISDGESLYRLDLSSTQVVVRYREISMIIVYSQLLEALGEPVAARELLCQEARGFNNRMVFHYYASLLAKTKELRQAMDIYRTVLATPPYDKQFLVEYALLLRHFNSIGEMNKICTLAIEAGMPMDRRDSYYHGYALFLLGNPGKGGGYFDASQSYGAPYA